MDDDLADIPLDDDDLDPYRPDATVTERADHVVGVLLHDEDSVRRYATIRELEAGRLREVAALSLIQLRDELGTQAAAAKAVGISRQAYTEVLTKAGAPGAREQNHADRSPAYRYGQYLAIVQACARESMPESQRGTASDQFDRLHLRASRSLAHWPSVVRAAERWVKSMRQRPVAAEERRRELDEHAVIVAAWVADRAGETHLTMREQAKAMLGFHHERARSRPEKKKKE